MILSFFFLFFLIHRYFNWLKMVFSMYSFATVHVWHMSGFGGGEHALLVHLEVRSQPQMFLCDFPPDLETRPLDLELNTWHLSPSPDARVTGTHGHTLPFPWVLEIKLWTSCLLSKHLHSLSSKTMFFSKGLLDRFLILCFF